MNILVTGARAPIAADLAKSFSLSGHRVWMADSLRWPVGGASPHVQSSVQLPSPRTDFRAFAHALADACRRFAIDAIVPTSEEVFWLAGAMRFLPATVNVRTSPLPLLAQLHHKARFAQLATTLGYGAAKNFEITAPSDFSRLGDPARFVVKPVHSRFATRTLISPTTRDLARVQPSADTAWLAQTRVIGREWCTYNIADAGRLLLHAAYEPLIRFGPGASVYFSPVIHEGLRVMSERFIAATGFTGQISFDVIETETGLVAIECNPRGTSGVHLAAQQPAVLSAALLGELTKIAPPFAAEARMLVLPLLLNHPATLFRSCDRALLRRAKDAFAAAEIGGLSQARSLVEMMWRAARLGTGLSRASTADIEWNGEPIDE